LRGRLVVDVVYAARSTALVEDARAAGLATIDGVEFLAAQGARQLERMTGRHARHETLERAARRWLGSSPST
jgi:shikimate 5-dehydrogenase